MRPYGLKRFFNFQYPDLADCLAIGAKSQFMKMASKTRKSARRVHKKRERSLIRSNLLRETSNVQQSYT